MTGKHGFLATCQTAGLITDLVAVLVAIVYGAVAGLQNLKRKIQLRKANNTTTWTEPRPNLIVEYIKAVYQKYCPKIDWDSN